MRDMKYKMNEEKLNRIISAAYKDAALIDRLKVYFLLRKDKEAKRIFDEYRATADAVKNIPPEKMPSRVIDSVKISTGEKSSYRFTPAYGFILGIVVLTAALGILLYQNKTDEPVYSQSEIELAEEQVKTSLAIVNKIFKKTEDIIHDDVLPKRVGRPIHKSLTIINDVLTGG